MLMVPAWICVICLFVAVAGLAVAAHRKIERNHWRRVAENLYANRESAWAESKKLRTALRRRLVLAAHPQPVDESASCAANRQTVLNLYGWTDDGHAVAISVAAWHRPTLGRVLESIVVRECECSGK